MVTAGVTSIRCHYVMGVIDIAMLIISTATIILLLFRWQVQTHTKCSTTGSVPFHSVLGSLHNLRR